MTPTQQAILNQLTSEGIGWYINRYGLKVRGKRTDWQQAYWIAFLGWKHGWNPPRIERTFYDEGKAA